MTPEAPALRRLLPQASHVAISVVLVAAEWTTLGTSLPAAARDQCDCRDFPNQAATQAKDEKDTRDPSGLDGPIGSTMGGDPGIARWMVAYGVVGSSC